MTPSSADETARGQAIRRLRPRLRALCGEDRSLCRVAAERGTFYRGFRRWPERELHDRLKSSLGASTHLSRTQTETLADLWQLTEQVRLRVGLACDAARLGTGPCRGWDGLSDAELRDACREFGDPRSHEESKERKPSNKDAAIRINRLTGSPCVGVT